MIIIPMAGMSSRFFKAGFKNPKYMLEAHGNSLFFYSVNSFKEYFKTEKFVFIVRDVYSTPIFVEQQVKEMGILDFHIEVLDFETKGQAETVYLGLKQLQNKIGKLDDSLTIFNIDTFRPEFKFPNLINSSDGYLEVFKGEGNNWSFAKAESINSDRVVETAEKRPISNLCSTGLYHFSNITDYFSCYEEYLLKPSNEWEKGELYIAPLYNILISRGKLIKYHLINDNQVIFCGVPEEYDLLLSCEQKTIDRLKLSL